MIAHYFTAVLGSSASHQGELRKNFCSGQPVLRKATIGLEFEQAAQCIGAKDSVYVPAVEAERVQLALQVGDIVAAHHRNPVIENAAAELETGADEGTPGVGANDPIRPEATFDLKLRDCQKGPVTESTDRIGVRAVPERGKAVLDIPDRLSVIASSIESHDPIVSQVRRNEVLWVQPM